MARRIPIASRDELSGEHQAAYDEVAGIRGRAPVGGPSSVLIHIPDMAVRGNWLSEYLGEQSDLPEKIKRLAAILAARPMDCQFFGTPMPPLAGAPGLATPWWMRSEIGRSFRPCRPTSRRWSTTGWN